MKLLKNVFIGILVLVLAYFVWMLTLPAEYSITRSLTIDSQAKFPFELVNDHRLRPLWSPWDQRDPNMQRTYNQVPTGEGALYKWKGNDDVGTGSLKILFSKPFDSLHLKLSFIEPFESESDIYWHFQSIGKNQTKATWTITGSVPFAMRWLTLNMEEQLAPDLENGLALMKQVAEKRAEELSFNVAQRYVETKKFLSITESFDPTKTAVEKVILESLKKVKEYAKLQGFTPERLPVVVFHEELEGRMTIESGLTFHEEVEGEGNIIAGIIGGEIAVYTTITKYHYQKPYAYEAIADFIEKEHVKLCCSPYERYEGLSDDLSSFSPTKTYIYVPV